MKNFLRRMRFLFTIHRSIPFLIDFFRSKEIAVYKKIGSLFLIIAYIVIPFDIIPDFFALIGLVDDVSILLFILQLLVKLAPASLVQKYELERMI